MADDTIAATTPEVGVPNPRTPHTGTTGANPHAVLDLAMRIGDAMLSAGMSANDVVVFILRITNCYGLTRVHVDVTYTAISASYRPGPGLAPITAIRVVHPDVVDYSNVRKLDRLRVDIEHGLSIEEAAAAYERISNARRPYPKLVSTLGKAGVGPAVSLLFAAPWKVMLITFATSLLVDRFVAGLERRRVPAFFRQFAAAAFITLVAAGMTYAGDHGVVFFAGVDPTLVVVGGIVMLLTGIKVVGAVQDAIDEFYVTAAARMFQVVMRTAGIVAGIVIALDLAQRLGAPLTISAQPIALGPLSYQFAGAALIAVLFTLWATADAVTIVFAASVSLLGWLGYSTVLRVGGGSILAGTAGALLAAFVTTLLVRRTSVPGFGLITAALLPLVPGLALYNGLLQVLGTAPGTADPTTGGATLFTAFGVALGIAAGASLGTFLGRPIVEQLRRMPFPHRKRTDGILPRDGAPTDLQ
jgi:uncharacterized membrane protein YjjP (DUF1212 family)